MKLRWKEFVLALVMAVTLWYGMSGTEIVESQLDVRVDYKGIPKGLTIRGDGLVNKISVRLRGPVGQIRAMSTRDYVFSVDLSSLEKGQNSLPVQVAQSGLFGSLQIIDVTPANIQLDVDTLESKELPLKASLQGGLPEGYKAETEFSPEKVTVSGPSQELGELKEIIVPLHMESVTEAGVREFRVPLSLPTGVEASPSQIVAHVHVDLKRKAVNVTRAVQVDAPAGVGVFLRPARVKISAELPEAAVSGAGDSKEIRAFVSLPEHRLGTYTLPVRVSLPEGARLISIAPEEVEVTLEQKN